MVLLVRNRQRQLPLLLLLLSSLLFMVAFAAPRIINRKKECKECKVKAKKFLDLADKYCRKRCERDDWFSSRHCGELCCEKLCNFERKKQARACKKIGFCQKKEKPVPAPTVAPTISVAPSAAPVEPTDHPTAAPVEGCFMTQSCRDAGYEGDCCDCSMTEEECDAEAANADDGNDFPVWTDQCLAKCLCDWVVDDVPPTPAPTGDVKKGFGCYYLFPPERACTCDPEWCVKHLCLQGGGMWTDQCTSCQCNFCLTDISDGSGGDDDESPSSDDPPTGGGTGCYDPDESACDCSPEVCTTAACEATGGILTDCTSCACPETNPTDLPTDSPTDLPTESPADPPTDLPTDSPTDSPTESPAVAIITTEAPVVTTEAPTGSAAPSRDTGCGCYGVGLGCNCSPEQCDKARCEALTYTFPFPPNHEEPKGWTGGCYTCQCPDLEVGVDCPPRTGG